MWQLKCLCDNGGFALASHEKWRTGSWAPSSDRSIHDAEGLPQIIEAAVTFDRQDVPNCRSMEYARTCLSLIREAHKFGPSSPDGSGVDRCLGGGQVHAGAAPDSALTNLVAGERL